jgi:cytochrome P450
MLQAAAVCSVAVFLYFTYLYFALCWKFRAFPGPPAFPFIGNCYSPEALVFLKFLSKLRAKYGKVYTFFNFTRAFLVVADPVAVRRILSDSKTFIKGRDYTEKFRAFGQGLVTSNGEKHRKDRQMFGKYFIRSSLAKYAEKMNEIANAVLSQYIPSSTPTEPVACNIEKVMARLALRSFMNFALSTDLSKDPVEEERVCHAVSLGSGAQGRVIIFNQPLWEFLPDIKLIRKVEKIIQKVLQRSLNERKALKEKNEDLPDDCLQAMINADLPEQEMFDHFMTLICAGHDTTAFFISYLVWLLGQHQEIQDKLYNHIMERLGDRNEVTADDFAEMKYLQYCMMETLRLYAIIPAVSRTVTEEIHLKEGNITIPKDTNLFIPMFVVNRDPEIWHNPSQFIPERFEQVGNNDFTVAKDGFFPFGYGTRTCIGNTFALLESCIVVCKLMKRFRIEPDSSFRMQIQAGISLTTSKGINVKLRERM